MRVIILLSYDKRVQPLNKRQYSVQNMAWLHDNNVMIIAKMLLQLFSAIRITSISYLNACTLFKAQVIHYFRQLACVYLFLQQIP